MPLGHRSLGLNRATHKPNQSLALDAGNNLLA